MPQISIPIAKPGVRGLNLQESSTITNPEWCITATNCVFDGFGRIASRKGWSKVNGSSTGADVKQIHEFITRSSTSEIISASNNKLYKGTATLTDITGALTPTGDNWKFVNFYGYVLGFQDSHTPVVWSGSGNFAAVTFTTPTSGTNTFSGIALAAWGRIWATDTNKQVVKYSALLDHTTWTRDDGTGGGTGSGAIDMATVWPAGADNIVALAEFNNYLIIFGQQSIVMYQGADDPTTMTKVDAFANIGCIARDSVQDIGVDMLFLSRNGIESIGKTVLQNKTPVHNITRYVRDDMVDSVEVETLANVRSTYNRKYGMYLINFPATSTTYCIDTKFPLEDGTLRVTKWDNINPKALCTTEDGTLYLGKSGYIGKYDTYLDNTSTYIMEFSSGWFDLAQYAPELRLKDKILKNLYTSIYTGQNNSVSTTWAFDFNASRSAQNKLITGSSISEYGVSEYGIAEWAGGAQVYILKNTPSGSGSVISLGIRVEINNSQVSLHKIDMYLKVGKNL